MHSTATRNHAVIQLGFRQDRRELLQKKKSSNFSLPTSLYGYFSACPKKLLCSLLCPAKLSRILFFAFHKIYNIIFRDRYSTPAKLILRQAK